jgi:hypothetical protein
MKKTLKWTCMMAALTCVSAAFASDVSSIVEQMNAPGGLVGKYKLAEQKNRIGSEDMCAPEIEVKTVTHADGTASLILSSGEENKEPFGQLDIKNENYGGADNQGGFDKNEFSASATEVKNLYRDGGNPFTLFLYTFHDDSTVSLEGEGSDEVLKYSRKKTDQNKQFSADYDCTYKRVE